MTEDAFVFLADSVDMDLWALSSAKDISRTGTTGPGHAWFKTLPPHHSPAPPVFWAEPDRTPGWGGLTQWHHGPPRMGAADLARQDPGLRLWAEGGALAGANPVVYQGSDADTWGLSASWMIVSRMQDHIVETSDGALHLLMNRGYPTGLTLLTSTDGGVTWTARLILEDSGRASTADIRLIDDGDFMVVAYTTEADDVAFRSMAYEPVTNTWIEVQHQVVAMGEGSTNSIHPTVAIGQNGRIFVSYTEEVAGGIKVVVRWSDDGGRTWDGDETVAYGVWTGSSRMISADGVNGFLLAGSDTLEWISYDPRLGWQSETLDAEGASGRYSSHFSTTTIGNDIFVVTVTTEHELILLIRDGDTGQWSPGVMIAGARDEVSNVQISASDTGNLYIVHDNIHTGRLIVLESTDGGQTWAPEAILRTPAILVADPARFEAPEQFSGDLIVMQQVELQFSNTYSGLYHYVVDVDGDGPDHPNPAMRMPDDGFVF